MVRMADRVVVVVETLVQQQAGLEIHPSPVHLKGIMVRVAQGRQTF
jgi:acyl CoA:acetate/3-ketoacid CoA transferase alpha subunit